MTHDITKREVGSVGESPRSMPDSDMAVHVSPEGPFARRRSASLPELIDRITPENQHIPERPECTGFVVNVICHTPDALEKITSPEALRFMIGHMLDSWKLQEEIDYTLEVSRAYGAAESVGESPAPTPAKKKAKITDHVYATNGASRDPCCKICNEEWSDHAKKGR